MKSKQKQLEKPGTQNAERRIVRVDPEEFTGVIEFKIFAVQPDGTGRVVGRGAVEEEDLERLAEELGNLAEYFADHAADMRRLDEGEDD
jgi:hypothetical protein